MKHQRFPRGHPDFDEYCFDVVPNSVWTETQISRDLPIRVTGGQPVCDLRLPLGESKLSGELSRIWNRRCHSLCHDEDGLISDEATRWEANCPQAIRDS